MHVLVRRLHASSDKLSAKQTQGLIINGGWRYDATMSVVDATLFRGQMRQLRRRTADLARLKSDDRVLDVGCGTGALALEVARALGQAGRVVGVDPSAQQIARARTKAARRNLAVNFEVGVIESLPLPDRAFDVVLATLMMHHLPAQLRTRGLTEIARVLVPGGRLVIADLAPKHERRGPAVHFHAGGSSLRDLTALVSDAGFINIETDQMRPAPMSIFPGAGFVRAQSKLA